MKIAILGTGEHAQMLYDLLSHVLKHKVVGFIDPNPGKKDKEILKVPILGNDQVVPGLIRKKKIQKVVMGIGSLALKKRKNVFLSFQEKNISFLTVIHPRSILSKRIDIGEGSVVMGGAVINAGAKIGKNVVINNGAVVEHSCEIKDHVYISPNATLCGNIYVGEGAFIGAGATVIPEVRIERDGKIGAGACVIKNVSSNETVVGVPAKSVKKRK